MKYLEVIKSLISPEILSSELFIREFVRVPKSGANDAEIKIAETKIKNSIAEQYKVFLKTWNGIGLDMLRFYGVGSCEEGIRNIESNQIIGVSNPENYVAFASDAAGFVYLHNDIGVIYELDTDGGEIGRLADDFDEFVTSYLFGERSVEYMGKEWVDELRQAGVIKT